MRSLIAICTHNRASTLALTLASLRQVIVPDSWHLEVVVIANACTDATADVALQWNGPFPLHLVEEASPGLSYARNRALQHALKWEADLIIWNDDDVEFSPQYLLAYRTAVDEAPGVRIFGGRILPKFEQPSPSELPLLTATVGLHPFSCLDLGESATAVNPNIGLPFGANLAVRLDAVTAHVRFDPRLGVTPTRKVGFEETVYVRSVLSGSSWRYVPAALVHHMLPARRQSREAVRQFYRSIGQYEGMCAAQEPGGMPLLFGRPRWTWRSLASAHVARVTASLTGHREAVLRHELQLEKVRGYVEAFGSTDAPDIAQLIR